jgi:23S rRNA (uracil1939-C5)-methyltransferase
MVLSAAPGTVGVVLNTNTQKGNVILGDRYRTLWGEDFLMDTLCGLTFKLSVPSFYQVNRDQAEVLYGKALEFAALTGEETVLDLYCGTGTITLCMASRAKRVIGAEIVAPAIRDAKENALRNHITNAEFFCGDAAELAAKLEQDGLRPDVITVDPPRKGLAPEVIRSVAEMAPRRVVYVSCDPATLGRDVKRFAESGYRAVRAAAVDMFPGTHHVETVCLLERA